jgi:hypothetical protein
MEKWPDKGDNSIALFKCLSTEIWTDKKGDNSTFPLVHKNNKLDWNFKSKYKVQSKVTQ